MPELCACGGGGDVEVAFVIVALQRCRRMGCGTSRADASNLVVLCRERMQLIRAARDRRYALAAAHAAYFRALAAVGDALHRFVQEELVPEPATSPVIVLPSPERKGKPGSVSGNAAAAASNSSSATPLSHSLSWESSDLPLSSGPGSEASPKGESGKGSEGGKKGGSKGSKAERKGGSKGNDARGKASSSGGGGKGEDPPAAQLFSSYSPDSSFIKSSTAIPAVVYHDTFVQPWPSSYFDGYIYPPYDDPVGSLSQARQDTIGPSTPAAAPATPPPPPPPDTSSWDFFNPFNMYEEFLPDYSGGIYDSGHFISSPDFSDVRKQEGIPELEVEADAELLRRVKKEKKVTDAKIGGKDSTIGSSGGVSTREIREKDKNVGGTTAEKESKSSSARESRSSSAGSKVRFGGADEIFNEKKKDVTFEDLSSYATEESLASTEQPVSADVAPRGGQQLLVHGTRELMEVVKEIKENFISAAACGEDLSRMLEVGKVPYRSRSGIFRVFSSRILDHMALPLSIKSYPSFSRYLTKNRRRTVSYKYAENHTTTRSGNLSLILEKLYIWEKKLYKEVKDEEKLRNKYAKKYRLLRTLDERGEEGSKIDLTWASVRKLRTKISIIVKSVDAISRRMHKIRDEELQPKLIELIHGFIKIWKNLLDCHQKQLQILLDCKSHRLMMKTTSQKRNAAKATKKLEAELLNWCNCFNNWISVQKSYILALNGWLMKWLPQEQEQTPDGIAPFSPTKLGAPTTFIISNDWHHAINSISVEKIIVRMQVLAEIIHIIWESQYEEQCQRLEQQHLLQAFNRRSQSMLASRENGDLSGHYGSEQNDDSLVAIDRLQKKLDEKRSIHVETLQRLQDAASSILPTGLIPILEELETFTSGALRVYNGIRTSSDSRDMQIRSTSTIRRQSPRSNWLHPSSCIISGMRSPLPPSLVDRNISPMFSNMYFVCGPAIRRGDISSQKPSAVFFAQRASLPTRTLRLFLPHIWDLPQSKRLARWHLPSRRFLRHLLFPFS